MKPILKELTAAQCICKASAFKKNCPYATLTEIGEHMAAEQLKKAQEAVYSELAITEGMVE